MQDETGQELITIDQFRREYFARGARPSRADVRRWATTGTAEGARLRAHCIDGRVYVTRAAGAAFIDATQAAAPAIVAQDYSQAAQAQRLRAAAAELRKRGITIDFDASKKF